MSKETLTVKQLIEELQQLPQDAKVYLSKDPEGNGYATTNAQNIEWWPSDKVVMIYPWDRIDDLEDIAPKMMEEE